MMAVLKKQPFVCFKGNSGGDYFQYGIILGGTEVNIWMVSGQKNSQMLADGSQLAAYILEATLYFGG